MPKLLLVGIIEKTCTKTVIREIPGITDCFKSKDDKGGEVSYKVSAMVLHPLDAIDTPVAHHQWFEHPWVVAVRLHRYGGPHRRNLDLF